MATNGNVLSTWDEARQLGQLFMMGFDGTTVNQQIKVLIETYHVGSILLTAKNLESAAQTTQLVLDLQTLAHNAGHQVPLLIVIDQENGGVNSLYDEAHIRQFPSAMGIATTGNKQLARFVARATAQELSSCGVNWILGPVLDVLTNSHSQPLGVRSLGEDPAEVSSYGVEQMKGYQEGGLATCGKHFPSYGNLEFFGAPDDVPTITDSLENLSQGALVPFRNAIGAGIDAIMVGGVAMTSNHINVMHACLSEQICRDLLRHEMKFEGVVVSECLEMEALSRNIGISGGTVMAFKAGCDLILTCRTLSVQEEAINGLTAGLDNGMIERYRVQESVQRVLSLKNRYTSWDKAFNPPGIDNLTRLQPVHTKLSSSAYDSSVSIVRDQKGYLPLSRTLSADDELLLLTPLIKSLPNSAANRNLHTGSNIQTFSPQLEPSMDVTVMSGEKVFHELGRGLARRRNGKVAHTSYTANGVRPIHETLIERSRAVVVVTADAGRNMYQSGFAKHVSMICRLAVGPNGQPRERPCVVVAVSSPFDFLSDHSIGSYVCAYDFTETAQHALVKVLYDDLKSSRSFLPAPEFNIKPIQARQQWLVESFKEERDIAALDSLLLKAQKEPGLHLNLLRYTSAAAFILRDEMIEESHFVVRNSTTKELLGFCATYYQKANSTGHIGLILVDPERRQQSLGHSLHDRAIRALLQRKSATKFRLGCRLPNVFLGIPKVDTAEYKRLRQWFAKLGWDVTRAKSVCTMCVHDLSDWAPPDGLGQALTNPDIKYDLVHGSDYAQSILEHVKQNANSDTQFMYNKALANKEGCAIIRAKHAADGKILASVLLYRNQSNLSLYIPQVQREDLITGGITFPVITKAVSDSATLLQGLMLLAVRQLKRQGIKYLFLDYIDAHDAMMSLQSLRFTPLHSFDEVSSEPHSWTST